ncbi:MAG: hypothetical protein DMG96_15935 [Acidobacteria bacterium]|nr:MAG: hypothetical protein DMG96_15935 [Acidobacteriota bacterium]
MNTFLRILNALLLTAILATLIFIYQHMPTVPTEPITVQGWYGPNRSSIRVGPVPVTVRIEQD